MTETLKASFDTTTLEGKMKVFNAQSGASQSFKNIDLDQPIKVVDVLQYKETSDTYGNEQENTVTVLFDAEGNTYAGISDTVASAGANLIDFLSQRDELGIESLAVKVVKQKSNGGRDFFNLQLVG